MKFRSLLLFSGLLTLLLTAGGCQPEGKKAETGVVYQNPQAPVDDRVKDLLGRMTLEEKAGQMTQAARDYLSSDSDIGKYFLGSVLSGGGSVPPVNDPTNWVAMVNRFQKEALKTRLGIPMIYGIDAVHGHNNAAGAVIFPHNIGLGAANDPVLMEKIGRAVAEEMKATGIRWDFAPCVAVPQDPRWGRTYEGFGQVPELSANLGAAFITGLQGGKTLGPDSVVACAKHFVGDGGTQGGKDRGDDAISLEQLRKIHLPPYKAAVDAGVGTVMASFSSVNGVKMHAHRELLTGVLRNELGFQGFVVSDWAALKELPGSNQEQIAAAVNAGIDMVMVPDQYSQFHTDLVALVKAGKISQARIDEAVGRILKVKFQMGLFEKPLADPAGRELGTSAHREIAREAVRKSLVLLKNEKNVLPIKTPVKTLLVAGLKADDAGSQCGGWTLTWQGRTGQVPGATTILKAIQDRAAKTGIQVVYAPDGKVPAGVKPDMALAVVGETPYAEFEGDNQELRLKDGDQAVLDTLKKQNLKTAVVLLSGRPLIITGVWKNADALVAAWLPGSEGAGVADVLFGDYSPTGKLGLVWPRTLAQIPIVPGEAKEALFPLGFGLTY